MLDSDDEPRPAPVFKSKRKVARGKRRIREAENDDNGEIGNADETADSVQVSSFGSLRVSASPEPSRVSRWARYSALGSQNQEGANQEIVKEVENTEVLPDYAIFDETVPALSSENKAYTKLELPKNTFSLRESHFRDGPAEYVSLENEYADPYGNVSEEENTKVIGSDDEPGIEVEIPVAPVRDLEMYDSEVSVEEDQQLRKTSEVPGPEEILRDLRERLSRLEVGIKLKEEKRESLQQSVGELERQRRAVVSEM